MQKTKGITLIVLVITVVTMLILAGVAIHITIGDNGIFKKATEGAKIYQNATNQEIIYLNELDVKMNNLF